uniref:Uncharacterized protein n=1 Tax=Arundo donax TaxID=35708 RepID=A0A0A9PPZ8_ARUDO
MSSQRNAKLFPSTILRVMFLITFFLTNEAHAHPAASTKQIAHPWIWNAMARLLLKARLAAASTASAAASIAAIARGVPSLLRAPPEASRCFWRGGGEARGRGLSLDLPRARRA